MFKLFSKKKENHENFQNMRTKAILQGIEVAKKRDIKRNKRQVCFLNVYVSKHTIKILRKKGYIVETTNHDNGAQDLNISW